MSRFPNEFYVFVTPKDDPNTNSHVMIMEGEFAGVTFVVNWIKLRKKYRLFGPYQMTFHYSIMGTPDETGKFIPNDNLNTLVGQIIEDIYEKHY